MNVAARDYGRFSLLREGMCGNDFESTSVALSVIVATWYKPDSRNGLTADVVQVPIHTQNLERVPVVH